MDHIHEVEMFIFNLQFGFCVLPIGRVSNGEDSLTEESLKTMSRYRKITTICCAAVFALGLAACGGGGDDGLNTSQEQELQNQVATLQGQINDLRKQLGLEPADDLGDSVSGLQQEVADLQKQIQDAADAEERAEAEAKAKASAALGKAMHAALTGPTTDDPKRYALNNIGAPTLAATSLMVDAADGAGALATDPALVTLKAGASVMPLGSWNGMDYAHSNKMKGEALVTNEARVYTNQGPGKSVAFTATSAGGGLTAASEANTFTVPSAANPKIAGSEFSTAGTKTHGSTSTGDDEVSISGTYAGASGTYHCEGTCTSQYGATGLTLAGGTLTFKPGTGAMVSQPES